MRLAKEVHTALANGEFVAPEKLAAVQKGKKSRQEDDDAQYGYDVGQETDRWWKENGAAILSK